VSKRAQGNQTAFRTAKPGTLLALRTCVLTAGAALALAKPALAAELIVNGSFIAEDFGTAAGWQAIDDKFGTASQADDLAVWSDAGPNYGAFLRVCQDAAEVGGGSGGVWGAHIAQTVALQAGRTYNLSFWAADIAPDTQYDPVCDEHASASKDLQLQLYGQTSGALLSEGVLVASCGSVCGSTHQYEFVAPANENASLNFFFGGQWTKLKLAGVSLLEAEGPVTPAAGGIAVNQLGYLASGPKLATLRSDSEGPLPWELKDGLGATLASGVSQPFGDDPLAGEALQRIDFSSYTGSGTGLHLSVGGANSAAFSISNDLYADLARDSLRFFYYQRCGQGLSQPQAEAASWARSSDHGGDAAAACSAGQTCTSGYPLNVSKGWHDAGDYGKYVITGALSVWTLLNMHEHAQHWGGSSARFDDGSLNTGTSNGVSDLLDEARYELEFLLGMQVPEGNPLAGMAHHKFHSADWVPMPTHPESDASTRFLHPPSTAATLDLAAAAAQAARVWSSIDPTFAARCRSAAERAWTAALAHPAVFAPSSSNTGGGAYDDTYVGDEFYWAASELYLSTGRAEFLTYLRGSSHYARFSPGSGPLSWPGTAGLGTISLALVPSPLGDADVAVLRQGLLDEAERVLDVQAQNGYGVPLSNVIWGSNADALNAGVVLALAHDLTGEARYLSGATATFDYVLGKNPLERSFVTGTGSAPVARIHHTNFAPYLNASYPEPPPGFIVGGPNADLTAFPDPGVSLPCTPLSCWSEAAGAYWFIEVAINWNAPLAWLSSWLDERGRAPLAEPVGGAGSAGSTGSGAASGGGGGGANGAGATNTGGVTGGDPELSGSTTLDSNGPDGSPDSEADAGCACRVGPTRSHAALPLLMLLALAGLRRRSRG
jgi:endoglucanase